MPQPVVDAQGNDIFLWDLATEDPARARREAWQGGGCREGRAFFPDLHSAKRVLTCDWRTGCIWRELRL